QCHRATLQHVSCPAANASTTEFHRSCLAKSNHELKLGHFPSPSSLILATLPSMSLIPPAPFTRMNTNSNLLGGYSKDDECDKSHSHTTEIIGDAIHQLKG